MQVWIEKSKVKGRKERTEGKLKLGNVLWTPSKDKGGADRYSLMREIQQGDIILHLIDNSSIVGVSVAKASYTEEEINQGTAWDGPGYIVPLENYIQFDNPLSRSEFLIEPNRSLLDSIRESNKVFYNSKLNLNEGAYLTKAPYQLAELFNNTYKNLWQEEIPFLSSYLGANNKTASFYELMLKAKPLAEKAGFFFKALREDSRYLWVEDSNNIIGKKKAHYEFIIRRSTLYIELHFEDSKFNHDFKESIGNLNDKLSWFTWNGSQSIRCKQTYNMSERDLEHKIIEDLLEFDGLIGDQVRNIILDNSQLNAFEKCRRLFNESIFNNYIRYIRKLNSELSIDINDDRVVYSVRRNKLNYIVGQRYCVNINHSNEKGVYGVISSSKLNENSTEFDGDKPKAYYNYYQEFNPNSSEWSSIISSIKVELDRARKSGFKKHNNLDFENYVFGIESSKQTNSMAATNRIFYGPPGTGKTYKLSKELFPKYTDSIESKSREELLDELVSSYTWFEAIAAAIFEKRNVSVSDILAHELVIAKGNSSESKSKRATIWGQLQAHTDFDCDVVKRDLGGRREPLVMWKDENKTWRFHDEFEEDSIASSIELLERSKNLHSDKNEAIKRYEFTTFHQSFSYEDFIEGIKPVMDEENNSELAYEIQDGIFKKISLKARNNPNQKYALFIDEINRGNVANIFGELITLIEPDKREGEENELSVLLPYSKKSFSVPKNLDIIGTMNTADRSVEALDTALRRRFSFIEMTPSSKVLEDDNIKCGKVDIPKLLDTINLRIEKLLDKDHCIGHSYFFKLKKDSSLSMLQGIFKDNIIPLLQEYFYGDFGKIGLVLGKAFVTETNTSKDVFHTDFSYEDRDLLLERKVYEFTDVSKLSQEDFISIYG